MLISRNVPITTTKYVLELSGYASDNELYLSKVIMVDEESASQIIKFLSSNVKYELRKVTTTYLDEKVW